MLSFLNNIEIYTTKDGFNSYILHQEDSSNVILVDPISFDIDYYTMLQKKQLWVTDIILTSRWMDTRWQQSVRAIYNPQIVRYQADGGMIKTALGSFVLEPLRAFSAQVLIYGNCLFIGVLSIISQCMSMPSQQMWQQFLEQFPTESYIFSCYGPPDTLTGIREMTMPVAK